MIPRELQYGRIVAVLCLVVVACSERAREPAQGTTNSTDSSSTLSAPPPAMPAESASATTGATADPASNIAVELREWLVRASRDSVVTGDYAFVIDNRGQRPHTLEIRGDNGARWRTIPIAPGASITLRMNLPPGHYQIASTDSAYAQRGMRAPLVVVVP